MGRIVVGKSAGVIEGEAVVMTGGQRDVFHSRPLCKTRDLARVKILRGESVHQLFIFVSRDVQKIHNPFTAGKLGVKSPVNEHSEAPFFKIKYPFFRYRYSHN